MCICNCNDEARLTYSQRVRVSTNERGLANVPFHQQFADAPRVVVSTDEGWGSASGEVVLRRYGQPRPADFTVHAWRADGRPHVGEIDLVYTASGPRPAGTA